MPAGLAGTAFWHLLTGLDVLAEPISDCQPTPLHALHREVGAKFVPFAGYDLPIQFPTGIIKEHLHVRAAAGLFDVSHMGQVRLSGDGAAAALESLAPVDVVGLGVHRQRYAFLTNDAGGILDDFMVTNAGDHLHLVVNGACKSEDIAHLRRRLNGACEVRELSGRALLALQGPMAGAVMARLVPDTSGMAFMTASVVHIDDAECFVTRSGYTGEDGFEISVPAQRAAALARRILAEDGVAPIGLGARDSLRLEAGLCLYGNDIDATTTPVEAGLGWALSKARRRGGARPGGYPGADVIERQLAEGPPCKRVGLRPEGRAPVRAGAELTDMEGKAVGRVTSGGFGATVGGPVAMGYVETALARPGTALQAVVRGRPHPVQVAKLPFAQHRYFRG